MPSMEKEPPADPKGTVSSKYWLKCTIARSGECRHTGAYRERNLFWLSESQTMDYSTQMCCSATCPTKLPKFPQVMLGAELQRDGDTDTALHMWRAEQGLGREMRKKMDKEPLLNCVERREEETTKEWRGEGELLLHPVESGAKPDFWASSIWCFRNSTMGRLLLHGTQK